MSTHPQATSEVQTRIRHHCIVTKLMEVNKSLSDQCKRQLRTTPFGWLLNLHCNIEASGRMLEVMLATWNADERAFQVGDKLIPFTLYDVALILGLPVTGEPIDCNKSHARGVSGGNIADRVRLYMALVLSYFLFPTTSQKVTTNLLPLLDDRPKLGSYAWGKAVYEFLVSGLNHAVASKKAQKNRGNLHIQGCTALLQIWACEHLGIGEKHAQINQPFPKILSMVLCVLAAMPWEQQESVFQVERTEREALARHVKHLEDELNRVKGMLATVIESSPTVQQNLAPTLTKLRTKPATHSKLAAHSNPHCGLAKLTVQGCQERQTCQKEGQGSHGGLGKLTIEAGQERQMPTKGGGMVAAAMAMVDLVSSPSKGATSVRYTRAKTRAQKNVMIVPPESEPVRNEWVDAHFLYQPTAHDEAVLADLRKKWSFATRRATRRSGVDSNEVAISTKTYEIMGRDVSSLLGDQAQEESSRWISTAVVDCFKDVLMEKLTESGHPPPLRSWLQLSQLQHKEAKDQKRDKQPIEDDQPGPESVFRSS
uniref:Aminotransferase-like plant mobile domain-containing protein n=1 Tax=Fagus sylvatica TaxID=28930 RepID=A0A2N9FPX2_FAGSY